MCAQISVAGDVAALSSQLTSTLSTARGSYAHSALKLAKGAVSGASKISGS